MDRIPDLTGYLQEDAENILKEAGVEYVISETSSPRNDVEGEEKRVVRQVVKNEVVNITLCRY
ncbi:MAG: PASTA domain-containing protein [Firmicutes bacterium]|nr:PASTA domain-containing protein [Bacillota bacterium]